MIKIPQNSPQIDQTFEYRPGVKISSMFTLDSLTRGDYTQNSLFKLQRPSQLYIDYDNLLFDPFLNSRSPLVADKWKITANLQYLAYGIIEPLINYFGVAFIQPICIYLDPQRTMPNAVNDTSKHFSGEAIDFYVKDHQNDMYNIMGDVLHALCNENKNAVGIPFTEIGLIYTNQSYIHIGIAGPHSPLGGDYNNPRIFTKDFVEGTSYTGFMPCRGVFA